MDLQAYGKCLKLTYYQTREQTSLTVVLTYIRGQSLPGRVAAQSEGAVFVSQPEAIAARESFIAPPQRTNLSERNPCGALK